MQPLVSILFPCYNAQDYLIYSLQSIIDQDYKNLQIICINDGSVDETLTILNNFKQKDSRIIIVNNQKNLGLIASLNNSFQYITGDYFARMDADDYSPPNRISTQLKFILNYSQYDLVSTGYNYFKTDGEPNEYEAPIAKSTKALQFLSLFSPPLNHASVLGKTSLITSGKYFYDKDYPYAEDFEIFSRLVWKGCKITTLNQSLYWIRLNPLSVSVVYNTTQITTNVKIVKRNLTDFLLLNKELDDETLKIISNKIDFKVSFKQIKSVFKLLKLVYLKADVKIKFSNIEKVEINRYLSIHKLNIIIQANKYRFKTLKTHNIPFFLISFSTLTVKQYFTLINKLIKRLRHR